MDNSKNFRASIQNLFNVRCVFPANDRTWSKDEALFVARCMKEKTDNTNLKEFIEDIVTRLRTVSENGEERHSVIEALKYLSKNVFGNSPILELNHQNANPVISFEKGNLSHAGIARALQLVVSDQTIGIIHTFAKHSLLSVSRFHSNTTLASGMLANTTGIGCKDLRLRFIVYQLFQAVKFIHSKGLCLESINPCDIMLDDEMWVHVPMGLSERLLFCAEAQVKNKELKRFFMKQKRLRLQQEAEENNSNNQLVSMKTSVPRPIDYNEPLTIQWISGKISNFEYLMAINVAAGRTMMDPLYHPILPWVTDFTTNCLDILQPPSYRDLSKTKFRLSKGDTQLETTFRHSDPPHHIPESLSELTYYIYLARRTPMQVLRRVVRDVFVPEHYPQSMHRIYEWTPDECIPEFYMDSTVFSSIHKNYGFPDLEVPEFTNNSADEFIRYHRQVLESDYVSNNLHLWIDLTFGYCLEGQAAIDQMNVPLHHTLSSNERLGLDSPNVNKNPGFVMLFDSPHPVREISRKPLQSHIYSFDNSSDVDEEFKQLNAIYTEETNKKYQVKPLYLGQRHDLQGMEDYCALDRDSPMTKAFRMMNANAARDSIVNNNKGMNNNLGDSQMQSMGESIAYRKSRKSLIRPLADATWNKFRYLEDINLGKADQRGQEAANNLFLQTDHYKFADKTTAFIDSTYSIPSTGRIKKPEKAEDKTSTVSGAKETKKVTDSDFFAHSLSKNVSNSLWDYEFISSTLLSEELLSLDHQMKNQFHQAITLKSVKGKYEENDEDDELSEEIKAEIEELQSDDMFGLGCMIAELYNGRSLLSKNDTVAMTLGTSFQETLQKIYKRTLGMPLVLQRLISLLTHPNHKLRPRAQEILETCIIINAENSSIPPEDYITKNNEISSKTIYELKESNSIERFTRIQLVSEFIHSLFPDYFHSIYSIVSALKLSSNGLLRLNTLLNSIEEISLLPIDGLNLGLVHFLDVIADSEFFTNNLQDSYDVEVLDVKTILSNYWRIIDVLGLRLGLEGTERLVVPHVVKFLNSFTAIDLLRDLLHSSLFNILALRSGVKCFLKNFLPILLTYLSAGTLHHVLLRKSYYETPGWVPENLPLWTNATAKISEKDEWLKKSSIASIHRVQRSAVTAISNLSEVDALGSGICARYIIPSLLSLVGVPHLASTGFEPRKPFSEENSSSNSNSFSLPVNPLGNNAAISELSEKIFDELVQQSLIWARRTLQDQDRPNFFEISRNPEEEDELQSSENNNNNHSIPEKLSQMWANDRGLLESYIMKRATFNAEHMYCVKVIVEMGTKLGDVVISELILSNIVNIILPELESNLTAVPKQGTAAALMEIILLLNGLLPILSAETIHHDLLQPSRLSGSCIPRLLSIWPLVPAFAFLDENLSEELTGQFNILYSIENVRLHSVLLELCRLIVSMSMIVGAELTSDFVLPHLDNFFKNFVNTYGIFPVESKTMLKAFELGAEIYLPLVQIVSAEAFYTAVPNLNPRLELWLRGIGSNIPPTSPPLPANIWPEVTSEVAARPEKKKSWFPTWLRGYNSSSSSSSGANNNNNNSAGNGPNVAATPATIIQPGNPLPAANNPTPNTNSKQSGPFTVLPSLLKGKSQQPPQPDEYELRESDTLMGGDSNATPFRSKKGPFRTPSVIAPGQSNPFSPTNGTELVDMGTNLNADLARSASSLPAASIASSASIVSTSLESSSITTGEHSNTATNSSSNNPATSTNKRPPSIGRSVLSLDEGQIQQSTPFRRRKRAGTAGTEESEPVAEDDRPSGDSDDDEYEEEEDGGPALATDTSVILNDELESKAADGTTQDELLQEELHQKHSLVAVSPEQSPSLGATDRKTIDSDPLGAARNSFPKPQTPDNTKNSHELGPLPIDTDLPKPPSFPPIIDGNNSIVSATPRVLFSPEASDSNRSMKIERKTLDDSKNPFRRYQRLLNNRLIHNKSNRYSGYAQSPLKLRNLSVAHTAPPSNKRNSLSKMSSSSSSASAANNPNTNLSSNSNYLIINSQPPENETMDEIEFRESRYSELAWLLAGSGRWNVDKEMKDRLNKEQTKIMKGYKSTISYYNSNTEWNPAAQMSMTAPKIAVDVANDSCSLINFQLQANTQWKLEEPPGLIRCMVTNPNETLLMTCSRSGVRLFSLSTHPILHVSSYTNHSNPPFNAAFLRDGLHAMTCDGSIHLWDIETRQALGIIIPVDKQTGYSFASVIPSKYGIHATMDAVGDEQILATLADTVSYFDLRCNHTKPMNRVGEWILPQIPPPQGNFISATMEPLQLTCAYSSDNYVFAGSQTGGIYVLERRMGKLLNSWQAHDGPILKLNTLSERHILAVSDRSAAVWEYIPEVSHTTYPISSLYPGTFSQPAYNNSIHNTPVAYHEFRDINTVATMSGTNPNLTNISLSMYHMGYGGIGDVKKLLNIKNSADAMYSMNNIFLSSFENNFFVGNNGLGSGGSGHHHHHSNNPSISSNPYYAQQYAKYAGIIETPSTSSRDNNNNSNYNSNLSSSKTQKVLYCLAGHRMHSGFLPNLPEMTNNPTPAATPVNKRFNKEAPECDELRLSTLHFMDRKGSKLTKSKLQITSSVLLPLRRLLLIASEDGFVRVIS